MEPILSKLQEGVKYPRFERDATKTINDLVEHITKERGVYSSSIEPNPNEHNIWFNTDTNTLYIYDNDFEWTAINENVEIRKEGEFYPYPVINVYDKNINMYDWAISENKHYVIIINTNNIRKYLNNIVRDTDYMNCIIIGDDTNISGTFLINIYNNYIYYIKLSSSYIKEDNVLYCTEGMVYYDADNTNHDGEGLNISGFYTKERLRNIIEDYEGISIEKLMLNNVFIEPEDSATIIIGKQDFSSDIAILGEELYDVNIYMYNNTLRIGDIHDNVANIGGINWYNVTVFCNCKQIDNITITHPSSSSLGLYISGIDFIVGNNNTLTIDQRIVDAIEDCNIYIIKETDDDKSKVILPNTMAGYIEEYVNLCGTPLNGSGSNSIKCSTFITTTLDDIDKANIEDSCIDFSTCRKLIIDAPHKPFRNMGVINYLKTCENLNIYVTNNQLSLYLSTKGLRPNSASGKNTYKTDDYVHVEYKSYNDVIYSKNIYKH